VHVREALAFHPTNTSRLHNRTQSPIVRCVKESTLLNEAPAGTQASPRKVLVIVCAGVVLASLDLFIVNVALPRIARDFGTSNLGELSWVLNGYAIVYASLLVFFGRMADRYRRDLGFLSGWPSSPSRPRLVLLRRASPCSSGSGWSRPPGQPCSPPPRSDWSSPPTGLSAGKVPFGPGRRPVASRRRSVR
jgi:hypothetical protein